MSNSPAPDAEFEVTEQWVDYGEGPVRLRETVVPVVAPEEMLRAACRVLDDMSTKDATQYAKQILNLSPPDDRDGWSLVLRWDAEGQPPAGKPIWSRGDYLETDGKESDNT